MFTNQDLQELKQIYEKYYNRSLDDQEVLNLANSLVNLFQAIAKPITNERNQQ